jgi:hypothetical protein
VNPFKNKPIAVAVGKWILIGVSGFLGFDVGTQAYEDAKQNLSVIEGHTSLSDKSESTLKKGSIRTLITAIVLAATVLTASILPPQGWSPDSGLRDTPARRVLGLPGPSQFSFQARADLRLQFEMFSRDASRPDKIPDKGSLVNGPFNPEMEFIPALNQHQVDLCTLLKRSLPEDICQVCRVASMEFSSSDFYLLIDLKVIVASGTPESILHDIEIKLCEHARKLLEEKANAIAVALSSSGNSLGRVTHQVVKNQLFDDA